jgi:hypothetical protein
MPSGCGGRFERGALTPCSPVHHHYERVMKTRLPYLVNGPGGRGLSGFATSAPTTWYVTTPTTAMLIRFDRQRHTLFDASLDHLPISDRRRCRNTLEYLDQERIKAGWIARRSMTALGLWPSQGWATA